MKPTRQRQTSFFIFLCAVVYFISYLTRNSYNSAIAEITKATGSTADATGLVSTAAFLTYGFGQIICGILGDAIAPRWMISGGLFTTALCNLLMPQMGGEIVLMTVLWGLNGFAQAMFWPPMVRLLAEQLSLEDYNNSMVVITTASAAGNIIIYLLSPLCITLSGWPLIFRITGISAIAILVLWICGTRSLGERHSEALKADGKADAHTEETEKVPMRRLILLSGLIPILAAIVLHGMLRDGLTTWMPSLISDTFHLSSAVSVLTAVVLPIFSIISIKVAALVQRKMRNELLSTVLFFAVALICSLLMLVFFSSGVILTILLMALITACMHGINLMLISYVPIHFARYGKISATSGLLNAFTYIGSAVSTYGFALFSERYGWYFTIGSWAVIAGLGLVISLLTIRRWKQFSEQSHSPKK